MRIERHAALFHPSHSTLHSCTTMASLELVAPRPCTEKPKFTVGDLRRAIPAHCFERSAWKSSQYLLADLIAVAALVYFSTFIDRMPVPFLVRVMLWGLYWFFQGAVCTGKNSSDARQQHLHLHLHLQQL